MNFISIYISNYTETRTHQTNSKSFLFQSKLHFRAMVTKREGHRKLENLERDRMHIFTLKWRNLTRTQVDCMYLKNIQEEIVFNNGSGTGTSWKVTDGWSVRQCSEAECVLDRGQLTHEPYGLFWPIYFATLNLTIHTHW